MMMIHQQIGNYEYLAGRTSGFDYFFETSNTKEVTCHASQSNTDQYLLSLPKC